MSDEQDISTEDNEQFYIPLEDRGVVSVGGPDAFNFLQGLLTCNMEFVTQNRVQYGCLLTPQGKLLYDFFVVYMEEGYLLDCPAAFIDDILRAFNKYKLESDITIKNMSDICHPVALLGDGIVSTIDPSGELGTAQNSELLGIVYVDPRGAILGGRCMCFCREPDYGSFFEEAGFQLSHRAAYDYARIYATIPEVGHDFPSGKCFPLDFGFDAIHAIDFNKGCFIGQEVTARMKHKADIKKALYPVTVAGGMPEAGADILLDGKKVGMFCSGLEDIGMAHLLKAAAQDAKLQNRALSTGMASLRLDD